MLQKYQQICSHLACCSADGPVWSLACISSCFPWKPRYAAYSCRFGWVNSLTKKTFSHINYIHRKNWKKNHCIYLMHKYVTLAAQVLQTKLKCRLDHHCFLLFSLTEWKHGPWFLLEEAELLGIPCLCCIMLHLPGQFLFAKHFSLPDRHPQTKWS